MFSFILLLCLCLGNSRSLEFKSLGNATIPTIKAIENVEGISFEKTLKNSKETVFLPFILLNATSFSEKVTLNINNVTTSIKVFVTNQNLPTGLKVYIKKEITNDSILYQINFFKIDDTKTGEYKLCIDANLCATSFIFSTPIVIKFPKPKLGLEGDPIRITCSYDAYPEATQIIWSIVEGTNLSNANITVISSNDHIKLLPGKESNVSNVTLSIEKLFKNDTGIYMCTVSSNRGKDSSILKINVKDRWAALYPFIGIVIEVAVLVAAILVYEKYQIRSTNRNKKNYEGDDDNKEPEIPLAGGDEDMVTPGENGCPAVEIEGEKPNNVDIKQREATTKNV